ncbi:hypothetical protein L226DRAFT_496368 [Lentinus tigrinus ALCF2SS1-7]|uniref:uncharacterized protein n=1 Tax=Lentinus tigrinus ALCF2SS1-7 TaxID=1328758 RepID=UPI001165EBD3|nr:hypothetical protein L226DRAFT_496368 [Lentinus tigrinus ALCF2SS1-7]
MSATPSSRSTGTPGSPAMPSTRATSPPTSPVSIPDDVRDEPKTDDDEVEFVERPTVKSEPKDDETEDDPRLAELETLLQKSATYVTLLKDQMDQVRLAHGRRKPKAKTTAKPSRKRARVVSDSEDEREAKRRKATGKSVAVARESEDAEGDAEAEKSTFEQPALITGATLKDYQLEGVAWMAGLYQNGISGILADEMGLGKTIQTIAFHAFLRERTPAPFMVVCPLAVLDNWAREFERFAPDIPVVTYYGTKEERHEIRRTQMVMDAVDREYYRVATGSAAEAAAAASKSKGKGKGKRKTPARGRGRGRGRAAVRSRARRDDDSSEDEAPPRDEEPSAEQQNEHPLKPHQKTNFPVVLTTYQIVINDRAELARYHWGFIVVDEGHRLKNIDCVLMREIKKIPSAARLVLTGTPLQNNLSELWALLNFVLPDLFGDLSTFQSWFDESRLQSKLTSERQQKLIQSLHDILRPFLLRRMKADVEMQLPPKKEYVLYTPLSERQRELYEVVVQGDSALRQYLIKELREEAERMHGGAKAKVVEGEKTTRDCESCRRRDARTWARRSGIRVRNEHPRWSGAGRRRRLSAECERDAPDASSTLGCSGGG